MAQNILGVVGWSGSGKTTLLEFLVKELCTLGHSVNVVKHSHHDIIIEPPQKIVRAFAPPARQRFYWFRLIAML
jgi:molybdopterin-guanine dinucleotide biosynthesis protein MobB